MEEMTKWVLVLCLFVLVGCHKQKVSMPKPIEAITERVFECARISGQGTFIIATDSTATRTKGAGMAVVFSDGDIHYWGNWTAPEGVNLKTIVREMYDDKP